MIYIGKFEQKFTSGKFDGIVISNQTITFTNRAGFVRWLDEINAKHKSGKLNYFVTEVK